MSSGFPLTFGRPESANEAWMRLPDRTHPLYGTDQVLEHLTHLKEWFAETYIKILEGKWTGHLDQRFAPMTYTDMQFMRRISFAPGPPLVTAQWQYLPEGLDPWWQLFDTEDNAYRWWQVCPMTPQPLLPPDVQFVSIETNSHFDLTPGTARFDARSDFEVGWTESDELAVLLARLRPV